MEPFFQLEPEIFVSSVFAPEPDMFDWVDLSLPVPSENDFIQFYNPDVPWEILPIESLISSNEEMAFQEKQSEDIDFLFETAINPWEIHEDFSNVIPKTERIKRKRNDDEDCEPPQTRAKKRRTHSPSVISPGLVSSIPKTPIRINGITDDRIPVVVLRRLASSIPKTPIQINGITNDRIPVVVLRRLNICHASYGRRNNRYSFRPKYRTLLF